MKVVGAVIVGLLVIAGMFAWNRHKDGAYQAELALWKAEKRSADSVVQVKDSLLAEANARNAASVPIYLTGKDRIIRVAAGTPAAEPVRECFELADTRISACESARQAADSTITALRNDLKVTEEKPERQLPRFQMYGAAGYSLRVDSAGTQMAPAFRAGIDSRLIGPIRLMTDGQLSMPGRGRTTPLWQANVMARINF